MHQQQQLTISVKLVACTVSQAMAAPNSPMPNLHSNAFIMFDESRQYRGCQRSVYSYSAYLKFWSCLMQHQQLTISVKLVACTASHAIAAPNSPMPNLHPNAVIKFDDSRQYRSSST
jgi:hypothetical protein